MIIVRQVSKNVCPEIGSLANCFYPGTWAVIFTSNPPLRANVNGAIKADLG